MIERETRRYRGKDSLTLIFTSILLFCVGSFVYNVFADTSTTTISFANQTPGAIGVNPNTNKIYIANFGNCSTMWSCSGSTGTTVSVIDGSTNSVTNTITVGNLPLGVGVNSITNKIYVSNVGSSTVSVIDGSTNSVTNTIKVGSAPIRVAVNPSTNKIYVANYLDQTVSVIDGSTNAVTSTFVVGSRPTGIDVNNNTNTVYVTSSTNTLSVIDGSTNAVITTMTLKQNPWDVKVNPITNMIYVRAIGDDCSSQCVPVGVLYVINGATNTLVTISNLDPQLSGLVVNPVAINPVTNNIYATEYNNNTVSVIDGKTNGVVNSIPVGNHPNAVAVNPSTSKIYVANDYSVTVIQDSSSAPSPPSPPQNLQAVTISSSQINLSWTVPATNGGSAITGYEIERSADNGTTWSAVVPNTNNNETAYSDTGLAHSTIYSYRVSAINNIGPSPPSIVASATTFNVAPSSPTGLTAKGKIIHIDLTWIAPSDNGGTPILGYIIQRSTDNGATWSMIVSDTNNTGTTYTDSHLLPVRTYSYQVSAINSVGTSDSSNIVSTKPLSTPHLVSVSNKDETHFK